jgi:hypothetical protein
LGTTPLEIICTESGLHEYAVAGGDIDFQFALDAPLEPGESCTATIFSEEVSDTDTKDPPDHPGEPSYIWHFSVSLDGLIIVIYNGETDMSYSVFDLSGFETNEEGYFVAGNASLSPDLEFPDNKLQNGPDAIAIFAADVSDFPNGTPVTTEGLIDAVVYITIDDASNDLLALLVDGQAPANEDELGDIVNDSLQRCPNGAGGQRVTEPFRAGSPTPGLANECPEDDAPFVTDVFPGRDAVDVPIDTAVTITFSEEVAVDDGWFEIACTLSGNVAANYDSGPITYTLTMTTPLPVNDMCEVTVFAANVYDLDADDPPDTMALDDSWNFHTQAESQPVVAGFTTNGSIWRDQPAIFTNTSTGPAPLTFSWDFGDGSATSSEVNPMHFYPAPGSYVVVLTASTGVLSDTFDETVVVLSSAVFLPAVIAPPAEGYDVSQNARSVRAIHRH